MRTIKHMSEPKLTLTKVKKKDALFINLACVSHRAWMVSYLVRYQALLGY